MKVFSFTDEKGNSQIGIESEGQALNFSEAWEFYKQVKNRGRGPRLDFLQIMVEADFFNQGTFDEVLDTFRQVRPLEHLHLEQAYTIQPPIGRPQKILCIGRNYQSHAEELDNPVPEEPIFFNKAPSSLIAHDMNIRIPQNAGRVDFEGELAVVVGKYAKEVETEQALDYIVGYTILNDVTAREMQRADIGAGRPWFRAKSFDTFCPIGPYLVPKDSIKDLSALEIEVRVNGEVKQRASVSEMIFKIEELVSYISRFCTLVPGDVIATGTPSGVGALTPGDIVECEVSDVGILRNKVVQS